MTIQSPSAIRQTKTTKASLDTMADFGFWELAVIALVGLLIIGPERLPHVAEKIGHWTATIKRLALEFKSELNREIEKNDLKKTIGLPAEELRSLQNELHQAATIVNQNLRSLDPVARSIDEQIDGGRFVSAEITDTLTEQPEANDQSALRDTKKASSNEDKKPASSR